MTGKVVVITGASSGLGFESARTLASLGATVVCHGRNFEKLDKAAMEIKHAYPNSNIDTCCFDLSLLSNTVDLANSLLSKYQKIDVLINNAGISTQFPDISVENLEKTFVTNHLSHFLLTYLLLERLVASNARIINVSSCEHTRATFNPEDIQSLKSFALNIPYARSKLYNIMFTYELDRRLHGTNAVVNAVNPGRVRTSIGKNDTPVYKAVKETLDLIASVPVEEGAKPQIHLASSPSVEGISGKYYDRMHIASSSTASYNQNHWKILWDVSLDLCKNHLKG
jgi:NAD(P)-dependent dehydrogenase (short-subunit alcohol dehydrogenase family)